MPQLVLGERVLHQGSLQLLLRWHCRILRIGLLGQHLHSSQQLLLFALQLLPAHLPVGLLRQHFVESMPEV